MSKFKKILILVGIICVLCFSGCTKHIGYSDMDNNKWLQEQVEQGKITQEQADALKEQLKKTNSK